ncbi:hypothetical protein RND71_040368 [Anisodus tanguticus]|uniref:TF-B3 domain-containing protein n=1 Tax=Anisodus tanguticus TaxID=243964 RepID=A0AAE1UT91_9SOLA|nr:hypothetical protein RND71_040368 [Anisodus tanguticus]
MFPKYISKRIYEHLHPIAKTAILKCCGQNWVATLTVSHDRRRLKDGWKIFVVDNNIKRGCVLKFELLEVTPDVVVFDIKVNQEEISHCPIELE